MLLLPANQQIADVIPHEVNGSVRLQQDLVSGVGELPAAPMSEIGYLFRLELGLPGTVRTDPRAFDVGNLAPTNEDRLFKLPAVSGMQPLTDLRDSANFSCKASFPNGVPAAWS